MLGITVREALQTKAFSGAIVLGGEYGLDRIIHAVNIMEVPDISIYVKPSELLMTTAYPLKDDRDGLKKLIPALNANKLAALAIKPHRYLQGVPDFMVEQANDLNFPLIQLANDASFNDIINPLLAEILNRQATVLSRNVEISQKLANIMLHGGGLNQIIWTLANILELPISLHNTALQKVASCLAPRDFGAEKNNMLEEVVNNVTLLANYNKEHESWVNFAEVSGWWVKCRPITVAGELYAYLFIWEPFIHMLEKEIPSLEQAITMIALEISKNRAINEVEARFKSSYIGYLLDGQIDSLEEAISGAEKFGWHINDGFTVIVFECPEVTHMFIEDLLAARNKINTILNAVEKIVQSVSVGSAVVEYGGRILVLQRPPRGKNTADIKKNSIKLAEMCCQQIEKHNIKVISGISRMVPNALDLAEGMKQAKQALESGTRISSEQQVTHFDDLGLYRILLNVDADEMRQYYNDTIGALSAYDQQFNTQLVLTLKQLFECNLNMQKTSEVMFIHYNTLRYRVMKIQEITNSNLRNPEHRLNLEVAVKIFNIRQ